MTIKTTKSELDVPIVIAVGATSNGSMSKSDKVELEKLSMDDFVKILTATKSSLTRQYEALLGTEGVELVFATDGIAEIARLAFEMNEKNENIGARRLNTIMEKLLEDISFDAPDLAPDDKKVHVDEQFVRNKLQEIVEDKDLSKYIL